MKMEGKRRREEDLACDGKTLSAGTWEPGRSGRNGRQTGRRGRVPAITATTHRENYDT